VTPEQILALLSLLANGEVMRQKLTAALQQSQARVAELEAHLANASEETPST